MKKKSKTTKKAIKKNAAKLRRKAMALWIQVVREYSNNKCAVCGAMHGALNENGRPVWLNSHHIEMRENYATRWDVKNGLCTCPKCHKFSVDSAHRSPVWFINWLRKNRPGVEEHILEARNARPHTALGWTTEELEALVASLSEQLAKLTEGKPSIEANQPMPEPPAPSPEPSSPPPSPPP